MVTHTAMNPDQRFRQEDLITIEIEALKKIFEDRPLKSIITLSCKCSDCGNDVIIDISPTSEGFGIHGAFLFECARGKYLAKCRDCCNLIKRHY